MKVESKGAITRSRLVDAVAQALIEGGGDFEMSEISRRAGVSDGLPYHHLGSKAGALSAVIDDFYDRYHGVLNRRLDGSTPWAARERERMRATIAFLYRDPLTPIVLGKMGRTVEVAAVESSRQAQLIELAQRNIELGQRSGEIPSSLDAGIAAAAIIGSVQHVTQHAFARKRRPHARVVTEQLWALISGALALENPSASGGKTHE